MWKMHVCTSMLVRIWPTKNFEPKAILDISPLPKLDI